VGTGAAALIVVVVRDADGVPATRVTTRAGGGPSPGAAVGDGDAERAITSGLGTGAPGSADGALTPDIGVKVPDVVAGGPAGAGNGALTPDIGVNTPEAVGGGAACGSEPAVVA
jgi:hypothetical protein